MRLLRELMEGWCVGLGCAFEWVQKLTHLKHTSMEEVLSENMIHHQERGTEEGVYIIPRAINSRVGLVMAREVVVIMNNNILHHHRDRHHLVVVVVGGLVEGVVVACHALIHHLQDMPSHRTLKIVTHHRRIVNMEHTKEVMSHLHIIPHLMTDTAAEREEETELLDTIVLVLTDSQDFHHHQLK